MRESRLYGSVRGALRNERPYRDPLARLRASSTRYGDIRERRRSLLSRSRISLTLNAGYRIEQESKWPGQTRPSPFLTLVLRAYSSGSTLTIAEPWLLPTQSTGRGPVSWTKTRRMLVVRGSRYSVISPLLVSSRDT
jgi:hypothetical protein